MVELTFKDFQVNKRFDLGEVTLSEKEIIDYAKAFDPLDFHIDVEAAKKSHFKGLVASGSHIFALVHRTKWIPVFGKTLIAGLEINNWKFLKPIYVNQKILSSATITSMKPNLEKKHATVVWLYEFKNENDELVQVLETTILHKIT